MALKQIKNKIVATKKTGQVTKAMESVSAVKMRKSQERAFLSRPYVHTALSILKQLLNANPKISHELITKTDHENVLVVIVTSDKGLAGSINSAVLKQAEIIFRNNNLVDVIAIGRKALEFAQREKKNIIASYTNISDSVKIEDIYEMSEMALNTFKQGEYKSVQVVYQNFVSTFEQNPTVRQVLPVLPEELEGVMRDIKPKTGKFSENNFPIDTQVIHKIEPSPEETLDVLLPELVQVMFYHALLESKASEHSARMVAMKNATDKSKELVKALTIKFNKQRQAAITAEVSEITAGVEAMK